MQILSVHTVPDESSLGSVGQVPSVGGVVLPANVLGVVPQSAHLHMTPKHH